VHHKSGNHWWFPKWHKIWWESDQESAMREVLEETGVVLSPTDLVSDVFLEESYQCTSKHHPWEVIQKRVVYCVAHLSGGMPLVENQEGETIWVGWFDLAIAQGLLSYKESQEIFVKALHLLS
jgi:8-oxo-dGTP pyrophosphatase MutT (NUDIX family)